ncbi:MAG: hypothetical protein IJP10_01310 [Clostridia bacterium]|nr:hypothetical protein [Clostridia bacterium]
MIFSLPVSAAAVTPTDVDPSRPVANFTVCEGVPSNVEIPEFYMEVGNAMSLYVFMTADGKVYKRIYGDVDGIYGWYEAVGSSNTVYADTPMVDINKDREIYYASPWKASDALPLTQNYAGILPPEEGVSALDTFLGVPVRTFALVSVGIVFILCIFILSSASSYSKRRGRR